MMRFITRSTIFVVSILASYLLTGFIEERVLHETEQFRPFTATLLGMGIIVLVFAPVFSYTEKITEAVIKSGLQQTKAGAGRILGVLAFVAVVFVILFALFLDRWFHMSVLDAF